MPSSVPIASSETAAWTGFALDRMNRRLLGSPADATSRPAASQTATSPRCSDSWRPERTTRTSGAGVAAIAQCNASVGSSL
jgi:hypothetical protein